MAARKILVPYDFNGNEIQNVRAQVLATDPVSPLEGQFWYNSTDETFNFCISGGVVIALDGSGSGGDADTLDAQDGVWYLDRANHTGSQAQSTITGLTAALALLAPLASPALTGNPTAPTATLGDNDTTIANTAFVQAAIAALIGTAPGVLDTLGELSDALGDDPNFATTLATSLSGKAGKFTQTIVGTATTEVITHNLGTRSVVVSVHDITTFAEVECDVEKTSTNTITLGFAVAPSAGAYKVTVIG